MVRSRILILKIPSRSRLGEQVWGTQFHPEFSPALMSDMVEYLADHWSEDEFSRKPADHPVRDWLLSGIRESPDAGKCLKNFMGMAVVLVVLLAGLTGCATSQNRTLPVNPSNGLVARCDLLPKDMLEKCIEAAEKQGYVPPDKLTPEQRARFKTQGAASADPQEQRVLDQREVLPPDSISSIP